MLDDLRYVKITSSLFPLSIVILRRGGLKEEKGKKLEEKIVTMILFFIPDSISHQASPCFGDKWGGI